MCTQLCFAMHGFIVGLVGSWKHDGDAGATIRGANIHLASELLTQGCYELLPHARATVGHGATHAIICYRKDQLIASPFEPDTNKSGAILRERIFERIRCKLVDNQA